MTFQAAVLIRITMERPIDCTYTNPAPPTLYATCRPSSSMTTRTLKPLRRKPDTTDTGLGTLPSASTRLPPEGCPMHTVTQTTRSDATRPCTQQKATVADLQQDGNRGKRSPKPITLSAHLPYHARIIKRPHHLASAAATAQASLTARFSHRANDRRPTPWRRTRLTTRLLLRQRHLLTCILPVASRRKPPTTS